MWVIRERSSGQVLRVTSDAAIARQYVRPDVFRVLHF
jgi:hypothetical protein